MGENSIRLSVAAKKFNVSVATIQQFLNSKGHAVDGNPNSKISEEQYKLLEKQFAADKAEREEANEMTIGILPHKAVYEADRKTKHLGEDDFFDPSKSKPSERREEVVLKKAPEPEMYISASKPEYKVLGKVDLNPKKSQQSSKEKQLAKSSPQTKPPANQPVETVAVTAETPKPDTTEKTQVQPEAITIPKEPEVVAAPVQTNQTVEQQPQTESQNEISEPLAVDQPVVPQAKTDSAPAIEMPDTEIESAADNDLIAAKADRLQGLKILGKIELPVDKGKKTAKPVASSDSKDKQKRKRVVKTGNASSSQSNPSQSSSGSAAQTSRSNNQQAAQTRQGQTQNRPQNQSNNNRQGASTTNKLAGQQPNNKNQKNKQNPQNNQQRKASDNTITPPRDTKAILTNKREYRKKKRLAGREARERQAQLDQDEASILRVTEFISTNDLAALMDVSVNDIIQYCFSLGMAVSINSRLDAEAITLIASEFGFDVEFVSAEEEIEASLAETPDDPDSLVPRAPVVTIMGHVDHGKTSLLDYIRNSKVAQGEAGGITQHIGAYDVTTKSGRRVVFLDTPGHEAFTSMRARGAKLTDIAVIVIAADDNVMPQTEEAISHAQVAGVDIIFAINKIDKPTANPQKIKEQLAQRNLLIEEWGGKYPCQEISAKVGTGVDELLELIILAADLKDLKANPNKPATGTIIESSLDKGRGYVSNVLVQSGTLRVGDIVLAGAHYGKVKAMLGQGGVRLKEAGPSTPVQLLGFDGAPQAGDKIVVMASEREAREIAQKRAQIMREQSIRATKRTTLSDLGRRIALGYQRLNLIIKGDVDGSVEALSGSLLKLSTEEVEVAIIHKAVGAISESDVLLASASDAIIIGFQVRPTANAKKIAEAEGVEIRNYSIIYDAINDVKDALEGMLQPKVEEVIVGTVEVRAVFKLSKAGTVAGCYVLSGYIKRNSKVRIIRDNIVIYDGEVLTLKRFKDDVAEVKYGFECGLTLKNFNDFKENDIIEVYEQKEVKRTLKA